MKVLVNGIGNIGSTLLSILCKYKSSLGIETIYAHKRSIQPWETEEIADWEKKGVTLCTSMDDSFPNFKEVLPQIQYVFEATSNGVGNKNKALYEQYSNITGSCAQGSEKGYGIPFMTMVNNDQVEGEKFVHIVSCNTHGSAALLRLFAGDNLENLSHADMVVVRRSEDLGNHERLVSANVVARHLDAVAGTHHSVDVIDLFKTIGVQCEVTSSDITTPSQLLHAVRFNINLMKEVDKNEIQKRIEDYQLLATSKKFDSNVIFELGRRNGFKGRIYSHAILIENNLLISNKSIKGWAFIPQEGNTILSTIHAFLLQTLNANEHEIMSNLKSNLSRAQW